MAIDRHYGEVLALAYRTVGSAHAEDIAQEAFIKVARNLWRLDENANLRAWVYKVALNCCRDHLRKNCQHLELLDTQPDTRQTGPEAEALRREFLGDVNRFLVALPRRQREAFILRRLQGLNYEEIAHVMDCNAETARANVYQAFKKLRGRFSAEMEG